MKTLLDNDEVGKALLKKREDKKLSYANVEAETGIRPRLVKLMEEGKFSQMPGGLHARMHVKSYAALLGVKSDSILKKLIPAEEVPNKDLVHPDSDVYVDKKVAKTSPLRPTGADINFARPSKKALLISILSLVVIYYIAAFLMQQSWDKPALEAAVTIDRNGVNVALIAEEDASLFVTTTEGDSVYEGDLAQHGVLYLDPLLDYTVSASPEGSVLLYVDYKRASDAQFPLEGGAHVIALDKILAEDQ